MFFKNIFVFEFTRPFTTTQADLEDALQGKAFAPLLASQLSRTGFVSAIGKHGKSLTHSASGNVLMCMREESKILPAPYIKNLVNERIDLIKTEHDRKATKKEREQLKEDVIDELLPQAFTRTVDTQAYINAENNTIAINTSSRGKAEDFLALLRSALGSLPVTSITLNKDASETMTGWLGSAPLVGLFSLGDEAELHEPGDESPITKVKQQYLLGPEVSLLLESDARVTKVSLYYADLVSFVLHDDLSIKRIKFSDIISDQNNDIDCDDYVARIDADFTLMTSELNKMITDLHGEFAFNARDYLDV